MKEDQGNQHLSQIKSEYNRRLGMYESTNMNEARSVCAEFSDFLSILPTHEKLIKFDPAQDKCIYYFGKK